MSELLPMFCNSCDAGFCLCHVCSRVLECQYFDFKSRVILKQIYHMSVKCGILACWCCLPIV